MAKNDPDSLSCPDDTVDVISMCPCGIYLCPKTKEFLSVESMIKFPILERELSSFRSLLPASKPKRPYAFIFGHGLWNDLDLQATLNWLDTILENAERAAPWLRGPGSSSSRSPRSHSRDKVGPKEIPGRPHRRPKSQSTFRPRLIMTPNAAGKQKPDQFLLSQGNKALMLFEESVAQEAARRGVEHIGTWNMSIQSNKYDGVYVENRTTPTNTANKDQAR